MVKYEQRVKSQSKVILSYLRFLNGILAEDIKRLENYDVEEFKQSSEIIFCRRKKHLLFSHVSRLERN
ncbi:MAG: hypothetical protein ACFFAS_14585 [Promethearchaeota archaeon]